MIVILRDFRPILAVGLLILMPNLYGYAPMLAQENQNSRSSVTHLDQAANEDSKARQETEKQAKEQGRVITNYIRLAPQERVRIWKSATKRTNKDVVYGVRFQLDQALTNELIARGLDAAPYLAEIVRNNKEEFFSHRLPALRVLCAMDRFIPAEESPLPEVARIYIESPNVRGLENPFMIVDGRRIGKEAYETVQWAAAQADDAKLRLNARYCSGLLRQDFTQLPLAEQLKLWRDKIVKCNHTSPCVGKSEHEIPIYLLEELLAERAPESIPPLLDLLDNDANGFVRMEVIAILEIVDSYRMRLNGTDIGRRAIEAVRRNLDPKNPKRFYPIGWFPSLQIGMRRKDEMENRRFRLRSLQELLADDHLSQTDLTVAFRAFAKFYGEKIPVEFDPLSGVVQPTQEIRQFVAYLTKADPYFPSWDFFYVSPFASSGDQVLHPSFRARVARYYEHWKRFNSEQAGGRSFGRLAYHSREVAVWGIIN
jgi:hypothetical protein